MKRRNFLKQSAGAIGIGAMLSTAGNAATPTNSKGERLVDQWQQLGAGTMGLPKRKKTLQVDVAVVGGGLAGTCAAVAAARSGAKTVLIQDRAVLGGNASSEIRVNVNGVSHLKGKGFPERETGIIEEILIEHRHFPDAVAFGGWSLDEHGPGGIENSDDPPSFFHYRFSKVYEIPFRCLYSKNISNLFEIRCYDGA